MPTSRRDPVSSAFDLSELMARHDQSGQPWLQFLEVSTLRAGLYKVPAGGVDEQEPHDEDEIYFVVSGRGALRVEAEDIPVGPGRLLYVRSHVAHHFHSISEDLRVLVFFSAAEGR